ncbi:TonB-dependent siderophore receptor [Rhodopseudomonas sp. HC1]|uniref:TonB-dependent siderophore receptor n=1 Tax=Rhodopseudomonas infernalis TaxID=2897386 RepID=UPI001EE9743D|nr:TonB-dependent siderophore receptor [Rhodopseudomonas infernalis]MCG6205150.1 TonB-dependent siderophore receptor [Rhodopseudomonas infernalis]
MLSVIALGALNSVALIKADTAVAQADLPPVTVDAPAQRAERPRQRRVTPVRTTAAPRVVTPLPAPEREPKPVNHSKDENATENSKSYTAARASVGSKSGASIKDTPQSISVLTRRRLDEQNLTTVEDAMRNVTGMTVLEADAGRADIYSRGYKLDTIQLDGVTSNVNNFFSFPDLYTFDRVEVLRGPNALFTGSGNPSGNINLVRKRALDIWQFQGSASYGSFDAKRSEFDVTGPLTNDKRLRGRIVGAFDDKNLFYQPSFYKRPTIYGTLEYDLTESLTLSAGSTYTKTDYLAFFGFPAYPTGQLVPVPRTSMYGADWNRWTSTSVDSFVELEQKFDNGGKAKVSYRNTDRDSDATYITPASAIDPVTGNGRLNRIRLTPSQRNQVVDGYITTPFEFLGQTSNVTLGADWRQFDYRLRNGSGGTVTQNIFNPVPIPYVTIPYAADSGTTETQSGVYGQMRFKPLDWLTLIGGGRLSQWETESRNNLRGTVSSAAEISNKLTTNYGVVVDVTKQVALYASYADIFTPQTQVTAAGTVLPPRTGSQKEVGIKTSLLDGRVNAHFAVFKINDVNRALTDPANPSFSIAAGEAESRGFETQVTGRLLPGWDLTAGYAYTKTEYLKDSITNEGLPFQTLTPAHSYNLWSRYLFEGGPLRGLSVAGGARIVSSFYTRSGAIRIEQSGGYQVFTAQIGYQFTPNVWATLTATNVFDQTYYQYVNTVSSGNRYGEPRSVILKVSSKW